MSIPGSATPLLLATTAAGPAAAFQVDRSLRFDRAAQSYLKRTPASAGNRRTFTFSCWHKKSGVNSSNRYILFNSYASGSVYFSLEFETEKLKVFDGGAISGGLATDGLFRDSSAWYHIVCAIDTTDATAANRVKLYVNGVQQTLTGTQPSQNSDLGINTTTSMLVGAIDASGIYHNLDGYLAETHFIDGQALAPTDFGETDSDNNWNPKAYSGTYGTNGFKLNFSDNSSNEALGYDQSVATPSPNPDGGMDVVTYTGNGSTQNIGGLGFEPDFVWLKSRNSSSYSHNLYDSVRGATKILYSDSTATEGTDANGLTAFNSNGFSLGSTAATNNNSTTYVAWAWKAGGPAVTNTAGTITSQVSVNADYGFSICSFDSPSSYSSAPFGHGLPSAPKWVILKDRNGTGSWTVYHASAASKYFFLNTGAAGAGSNNWTVTSTTVDPGAGLWTATNSPHIAYCWSEVSGFSKFGSYSGSGSANKTVTGLGFRPRLVIIKRTDILENWQIVDSERGPDRPLFPDLSDAEQNASGGTREVSFQDDGFTLVGTHAGINASGGTYIYAAFADRPGNNFDVNNLVATAGADGAAGFDAVTYTGNGGTQKIGGPVYSTGVSTYLNSFNSSYNTASDLFDGGTGTSNRIISSSTSGSGIKFVPSTAITGTIELWLRNGDTDNSTMSYSLDGGSSFTNVTTTGGNGSYVNIGSQTIGTTNGIIVRHITTAGTNAVDWRAIRVDSTMLVDGTGAPLKFQPDLLWIKSRSKSGYNHKLVDSVRGNTKTLRSNATGAEFTNTNQVTSFNSDGFSLGADNSAPGGFECNELNNNFVAWAWNAGANSNKTYTVKVVSDSGNKYRFDDFGTSAVTLDLQEGSTYVFDQSDSSNAGHPIRFGTSANGTDYTTGVTHTGTPGSAGAKTTLVLGTGVATLYYSCANHSGMGGQINTNSTAGASNFDGSIQATTKASTTYGFSIVSFEAGTSGNLTVGHGLGANLGMFIVKDRDNAGSWQVWHTGLSNSAQSYLQLNDSDAAANDSNIWVNTAPTSSVFSVKGGYTISNSVIAYCWSEVPGFSKFGSYSGGTNPRTITTGFKTAFVLIKSSSHSSHWQIIDATRGGTQKLASDLSVAENDSSTLGGTSINTVEFLDDGFKLTTANTGTNQSGYTYIYMAFADTPDGSGIDSLIDTPTNYDAASGNNGGNYATWNPLSSSGVTLSNGNLDATNSNSATKIASSTIVPTAKCYWEVTIETPRTGAIGGIHGVNAQGARPDHSGGAGIYLAGSGSGGGTYVNGTKTAADYSASAGDIIGFAFDPATRGLIITRNGSSVGTLTAPDTDDLQPVSALNQNVAINVNFGQHPFAYTPPAGYKSLCTQNLPDPTIADGSTVMDAKLWTGTGSSRSITGYGFSPDLAWIKSRSDAYVHYWVDTVRGAANRLQSNSSTTELNSPQSLTAFNSDGFDLGNEQAVNENNDTFVGWAWDAGTSTVNNNTDGSITPTGVRANASAGFSIVTWTGTSSNETVGHGLNAAPGLIIAKARNEATFWPVYHSSLGRGGYLALDETYANDTNYSDYWGDAEPTNAVFGIKGNSGNNRSGKNMLAYCFAPVAGYSAFGTYTGNGAGGYPNADGPFVFTGMRPRFVLIKANQAENWVIYDTARSTYNVLDDQLYPNASTAETSGANREIDVYSNGFKIRSNSGQLNSNNATYTYAAFAEHPFKTARAR